MRRFILSFLRVLTAVFFGKVEVTGLENIPESRGGLLVSWHPNGLIDPGLLLASCPRPMVFGARHGLFKIPVFGAVLRAMGTIPIYRQKDFRGKGHDEARRSANSQSLDALASAVAGGSFAALFPEGVSHDAPHLQELRTGAASLFVRALGIAPHETDKPVILPVGLHYDSKQVFGSNALVAYHPAIELDRELKTPLPAGASEEDRRRRYRLITEAMEKALTAAVRPTESWTLHRAMHRARSLMRAERASRAGAALGPASMAERILGFSRLWEAYEARALSHPRESKRLLERVLRYDGDLKALSLKDRELDSSPRLASPWVVFILLLHILLVYIVLPPILLVGLLVNAPTALVILAFTKSVRSSYKDEASVKLLVGAVAFPLTWIAVGFLVGLGEVSLHRLFPAIPHAPVQTGIVAFLLSAAGAWVALHYHRLSTETWRALRVRMTRARQVEAIQELREERALIFDELSALADGLELPGGVAPDGRIVQEE